MAFPQEFDLLTEACLSPDRILRMTGANAAEALRRIDFGIVEPGRRAGLVLLSADPRRCFCAALPSTIGTRGSTQGDRMVRAPAA